VADRHAVVAPPHVPQFEWVTYYGSIIDRSTVEAVTVSAKYQVVIPRAVRELLGIRPGQRVQVIPYEGRIELVPILPMRELRGLLRGIDTSIDRDEDRL
jgi:AbrB family looped-hinge helix DNA binding protein